MPWIRITPVRDPLCQGLCSRPYYNHPRGCPNLGKKPGCPPHIKDWDPEGITYAIYNKFDLGAHRDKMRRAHPTWTDRQLSCCLYWQPTARKALKNEIRRFLVDAPGNYLLCHSPEALGYNITKTMATAGIDLEWPPNKYAYQIVFASMKE